MTAAKAAAAKVKKDTRASTVTIAACKRQGTHRFLCSGAARYSSGAGRCTFDMKVAYPTHASRRPSVRTVNFICF